MDLLNRLTEMGDVVLGSLIRRWLQPTLWFTREYGPIVNMDNLLGQISHVVEMDIRKNNRVPDGAKKG
jgi:hypothetical protein